MKFTLFRLYYIAKFLFGLNQVYLSSGQHTNKLGTLIRTYKIRHLIQHLLTQNIKFFDILLKVIANVFNDL